MTRIFITTGPESSGKTTLAQELSAALPAPLVSEVSREYLNARYLREPEYKYQPDDLLQIAKLQHAAEQQQLVTRPEFLVCDTDLLVIMVWSEVKYGGVHPWIIETFQENLRNNERLYLLCDHNIPWQYDPLRENPHDRHLLSQRYIASLNSYNCANLSVSGTRGQRLAACMQYLKGNSSVGAKT